LISGDSLETQKKKMKINGGTETGMEGLFLNFFVLLFSRQFWICFTFKKNNFVHFEID